MIEKVNIQDKFNLFDEKWNPRIVGEVNDFEVKIVKLEGEFVWHHHDVEDEMFLVFKGTLLMKLRDRDIEINEGEFVIIPHGIEHKPVVPSGECHLMLFERKGTLNTGNVQDERTVQNPQRI